MIPTRYTLYPSAALKRADVPIHLRWTYLVLYALAWRHDYQWLDETYRQLAQTFTELEGKEVTPEAIRQRIRGLSDVGFLQRHGSGGHYRTHLLIRHECSDELGVSVAYTPPLQPERVGVSSGIHPFKNNDYVVVDEGEEQQQHLVNTPRAAENQKLLEGMGVLRPVAERLAAEEHVTPEYLEAVMAYRADAAAKGTILGPGWVVKCVGDGWKLPEVEAEAGRYRYIQGKYKEWVRH